MEGKIEIGERFINIPKIIYEKSPRLYRKIPRFVIRLIERIVHIDEVNYYVYKWRDYFGLDWVAKAISDFELDLKITGLENIPKEGNPMIVANHPLGGFDGIALIHAVGQVRQDLQFPVNDILMKLPGVAPLLIPINKHGRNAEYLEVLEQAFASNRILLFFPAGLVSRRQKHGIFDLEWKHTFISKSITYNRDVIPTYIEAYNSRFFYKLAQWRKMLGIKTNIEMLFLPAEVFKQKKAKIHIHFGNPISYKTFDKTKTKKEWAAWVKATVYELGKEYKRSIND
jgi:putative hemolysin